MANSNLWYIIYLIYLLNGMLSEKSMTHFYFIYCHIIFWAISASECLSVSCGGMGQQLAVGAGVLGAAVLDVA